MKIEEVTPQLIDHIFENLNMEHLDEWNLKFIESVKTWWKKNRKLSDKQKTRLGQLWEKQLKD